MSIKITLEFDNLDKAIVALGAIAEQNAAPRSVGERTPAGAAAGAARREVAKKEPGKAIQALLDEHGLTVSDVEGTGKDGAITKKDIQAVLDARKPAAEPTAEPAATGAATDAPTEEDAFNAMKRLNAAKGLQSCIDLLKGFNTQRVKELKPEQRADFIAKCDEQAAA